MTLAIESPLPRGEQAKLTPKQFLDAQGSDPDRRYELVDGVLVEKPPVAKHSTKLASEVTYLLRSHLRVNSIGEVYVEQPFACFKSTKDRNRVRKPDVAVVLNEKIVADAANTGLFRVPPDLAVEVVSDRETALSLRSKLLDYAAVDVPLVWVVYPQTRTVDVIVHGKLAATLTDGATLAGDPVLPGLSIDLAGLFGPVPAAR